MKNNNTYYLPDQRTTRARKTDKEFYIPTVEYCMTIRGNINKDMVITNYNLVNDIINDEDYKKILNPLNSTDAKYKRFPATLRNYDMVGSIVRRYMGEFMKQDFDYSIHSNDPDVAVRFNNKLSKEIITKATESYVNTINASINKENPQNNAETQIPDFKEFFDEFKAKYLDEYVIEGEHALKAIMDSTNTQELFYQAFYNYIVTGYPITYRDIRNGNLFKEIISPLDFTSLGTGRYIEDHDICKRTFRISPNDLVNTFSEVFDEKVLNALRDIFSKGTTSAANSNRVQVDMLYFTTLYGEDVPTLARPNNSNAKYFTLNKDNTITGTHITFKTEVPIYYVQRLDNNTGQLYEVLIEEDTYEMNPMLGDVAIQKDYINEIYETYVFGDTGSRIVSPPRPIAYQCRPTSNIKECKQPYNGIYELINQSGYSFCIPSIILPYQIFRNILFYAREKTIARNKDIALLMPKSVMGNDDEEFLYRLDAAGLAIYDDSDDGSDVKATNIRPLNLSLNEYIRVLTEIIDAVKQEAWESVDMNAQRYGDIATSAGKGTTQEAIIRSSMGSVVIYTMFDKLIERDLMLDLNYSKVTLSDQSLLNIRDSNGTINSVSFDSSKFILSDLKLSVRNSAVDEVKRQKLDGIIFNMSQNGDGEAAAAAVFETSPRALQNLIAKYSKATRDFQQQLEDSKNQAMMQVEQMKLQAQDKELQNNLMIEQLKQDGENQRFQLEMQLKYIDTLNALQKDSNEINNAVDYASQAFSQLQEANKVAMHREDANIKREQMRSDERIARMNKN